MVSPDSSVDYHEYALAPQQSKARKTSGTRKALRFSGESLTRDVECEMGVRKLFSKLHHNGIITFILRTLLMRCLGVVYHMRDGGRTGGGGEIVVKKESDDERAAAAARETNVKKEGSKNPTRRRRRSSTPKNEGEYCSRLCLHERRVCRVNHLALVWFYNYDFANII